MENLQLQLIELFLDLDKIDETYLKQAEDGYSQYIYYDYEDSTNILNIKFGFTTYEEGNLTELKCEFYIDSSVDVTESSDGHSCMGGDYKSIFLHQFENFEQFKKHLLELL